MREAAELNKQMDALIALRIKVDRENYSLDSSTTVPLRSSAPSTTMTRGKCRVTVILFVLSIHNGSDAY